MWSRKQIQQKINLFYDEVKNKRKNKTMRLQDDNEFQELKITDLNDENNVKMFTGSITGGKPLLQNRKLENLKPEFRN